MYIIIYIYICILLLYISVYYIYICILLYIDMHSDILQLLSHLSLERRAFHSSVSPRIGSPEGLRSAAQRLAHCVGMCVPGLI